MAKINAFECDVCHQEFRWIGWEDEPGPVEMNVPGGNIQYRMRRDEVCNSCAKALRDAFVVKLKELDPKIRNTSSIK